MDVISKFAYGHSKATPLTTVDKFARAAWFWACVSSTRLTSPALERRSCATPSTWANPASEVGGLATTFRNERLADEVCSCAHCWNQAVLRLLSRCPAACNRCMSQYCCLNGHTESVRACHDADYICKTSMVETSEYEICCLHGPAPAIDPCSLAGL